MAEPPAKDYGERKKIQNKTPKCISGEETVRQQLNFLIQLLYMEVICDWHDM